MKKVFAQIIIFLTVMQVAFAESVVINQVLYDPLAHESGGEAIELYNPTANAVNISGWVIATEISDTDVTLPNAIIRSGGYYLIADEGWASGRGNPGWPEADHEEKMTITNSNAGVAIKNSTNVIDAVGWGDPAGIETGLYEGTPHPGSSPGQALVRINRDADTDNNSHDFTSKVPDFHRSTSSTTASGSASHISVVAIVESSFPTINSFSIITDDEDAPGIQIHPIPKKKKAVEVRGVVTHFNGNDFVEKVELEVDGRKLNMTRETDLNDNNSLYEAEFEMNFYDDPGNYPVNVTVTDKAGFTLNYSMAFEYLTSIAIEIDTSSLEFRAVHGKSSEISGDSDETTKNNVTIRNIGNSVVDVGISGTNLTGSSGVIDVSNIKYTFNGDYENGMAGSLSPEEETERIGIRAAARQPLSFRLDVPTATSPGNYTGTITLIAIGK